MVSKPGNDRIPYGPELMPYVRSMAKATYSAENEEQLKIETERILRDLCKSCGIFWNPYTYEHSFLSGSYRTDTIHGSTIIEYEPPGSFHRRVNNQLLHARQQVENYCCLLSEEEGRRTNEYSLVVFDGETISFGAFHEDGYYWDSPEDLNERSLHTLLTHIERGGKPLVSPLLLKQFVGPNTDIGQALIPAFYDLVVHAFTENETTRTKLIFIEWARLFGQVDGTNSDRLRLHLSDISQLHGKDYSEFPQIYVFALNTYIALVAKICAVFALMDEREIQSQISGPTVDFLNEVERGTYFSLKGIENMLSTDFFSWYLNEIDYKDLKNGLSMLIDALSYMDFDITRKEPDSVRDLFKGLYMEFIPSPMRHALGEYYTPDWLASHIIDVAGWSPSDSLLDPTCGSGTFLLEALKRRLEEAHPMNSAKDILDGIYGFDLNPLAVLTARASLVVYLADHFNPSEKTLLPVYLADAINSADPKDGVFVHSILTEKGERTFAIPYEMASSVEFYDIMNYLKTCIDANLSLNVIIESLEEIYPTIRFLEGRDKKILLETVEDLIQLHEDHWDGIWCLILYDRIKAGCIQNVDYIVGNPPWVKWSNLPRSYASFIKSLCQRMDVFSNDFWVGGIQADISTVITYHVIERFLKVEGKLAFLITGTVFKNESSQGFRRWTLHFDDGQSESMSVCLVEDYKNLKPFENVANWPCLLLLKRNQRITTYPVTYNMFEHEASAIDNDDKLSKFKRLYASPIPGTIDGPWVVGSREQLSVWSSLFKTDVGIKSYSARKGITTDANGIYFVSARMSTKERLLRIENNPANGRRRLPRVSADVEGDYIYPLLRGRNIKRFHAVPTEDNYVIVPQTGMHGDDTLPKKAPGLFSFLSRFKDVLEKRSSYRRFQLGKPFWSIWNVGLYTFSPYKVVWKEMSGLHFCAAYVSSAQMPDGSSRTVIPDHKVFFIPVDSEDEAAYITAFLNSPSVSTAINAYASGLSIGTTLADYINIPFFNNNNHSMLELSSLGKVLSNREMVTPDDEILLDRLVKRIIG